MICIFGFITYLISDAFSLFSSKESILFTLIGSKKILWCEKLFEIFGNYNHMITVFPEALAFSYHNFQILSIKFLVSYKAPLPFKWNPVLFR